MILTPRTFSHTGLSVVGLEAADACLGVLFRV